MDPERWQRICDVFEQARGLTGATREALLAAVPDIAGDVRELLEHHDAEQGALADEVARPAIGTTVGRYTLEALLGEGGMATVYRASGPEGPVALKRLHPELAREPVILERFRREAELGLRIVHPNVVRTLDLVGPDVLVLELIAGRTLEQRLEEGDRLEEPACRELACEILRGLVAIHAAGAVHRDLKPSNVMLTPHGAVRLMDLGVALPLDDLLRLSRTGQFVGTVRYSAPEQLTDSKAEPDGRTDLYALGLLLHELVAGEHPFPRGGLVSMMRAQLDTDPAPLRSLRPGVTPFFEAFVQALAAKERAARPASAQAALAILEAGESGPWWGAQISSPER